jgi:hypothetical protein
MKFRKTLLLCIGAMPLLAHADWQPIINGDRYIVTLGATVNGLSGSITYSEDRWTGSNLPGIASQVYAVTNSLQNELNQQVREAAAAESFTYLGGSLNGEANVTLQPNGLGYLTTRLSGLSYTGTVRGSKSYWGLKATCFAYLRVNNIVATAQVGSATGGIADDTVGMTADVSSSANCDTNIGWIPIIGSLADKYAEHLATGKIKVAARDTIATMKDKLFFERDANAYAGINRIVPPDKVIPLPNGQTFAVGQWLYGQLAWILDNTSMTLVLGHGANPTLQLGSTSPDSNLVAGNVARMIFVVGGVTLNVDMHEDVTVIWQWRCSYKPCPIP